MTTDFIDAAATPAAVEWTPIYMPWHKGNGWYVSNLRYPNGASGCVTRHYPDGQWRIVCDPRRSELGEPGDYTFQTRDAAARAERELVLAVGGTAS